MKITAIRMMVMAGLLLPGAAMATVALAPVMHGWNRDRHQVEAMLAGNRPFDRTALDVAIRDYVNQAAMVADSVKGTSSQARDFAARFRLFSRDAATLAPYAGSAASLRPHFAQLMSECSACHAIYNN